MKIALLSVFRNVKIKNKIVVIFAILFLLMVNLSAVTITAVQDIQKDTQRIADELIPRLTTTAEIKDHLNSAIIDAYDYVVTADETSKIGYERSLERALDSEITLFNLSDTNAEFEFVQSFQDHINGLHGALNDLVNGYDSGVSAATVASLQETVQEEYEDFATFLGDRVERQVQLESLQERQSTATLVERTILNVIIVGIIAFGSFVLLYFFVQESLTHPIQKLSEAAHALGEGRFEYVDVEGRDEIGVFADTFNTMAQRIKATQESLEIELKKTKQLDRQKTEFLSIAAHQLRTPMSGIKWMVNMVADGDLGDVADEAKEQLKKGSENIDRMVALINQLLNVTEIEAKGLEIDPHPVPVSELLQPVIDDLSDAATAVGLTLTLDPVPEELAVNADTEKMQMVLRNIVDNGIKYTADSGTVTVHAGLGADNAVTIAVTDTGYGIPKVEQERIFSKFYRGSNIQTIQADGSGLGLFIAKKIVELHDGDLTFESEEEKGTTFTIELPVATADASESTDNPLEDSSETSSEDSEA